MATGLIALLATVGVVTDASAAPGIVWERVAGIYGARVWRLVATGDATLLASTGAGLYRSMDNGETWELAGLYRVGAMAAEGQTVYGSLSTTLGPVARSSVHRSDDGGVTWQPTGLQLGVNSLAVADGTVYATYPGVSSRPEHSRLDVHRSDDGGATWTETHLDDDWAVGVVVTPTGVVAASTRAVYGSADGQGGWVALAAGLPDDTLVGLTAVRATVYVAARSAGVYRYDANAQTWTRTALDGVEVEWLRTAGDSLYARTGDPVVSRQPGLAASRDGGQTWTKVQVGEGLEVNDALAVGSYVYLGSDGGVLRSEDDGASWTNVSRGLSAMDFDGIAVSGETVYVGGDSGVHASHDGGRTWRHTGFYRRTPVLAAAGETVYAATTSRGMFRSDDAGHTWREINDGFPMKTEEYYPDGPREILLTPAHVWVAYYHGAYLRSADGESWDPPLGPVFSNGEVFPHDNGPLAMGEHGGALYMNWHCHVARSFDDGVSWEDLPSGPCLRGADFHTFGGQLYIADEDGVYRWNELAREWIDASEGLPLYREGEPDERSFYGTRFASLGKSLYVGNQVHGGVHRLYASSDTWVSAGLEEMLVWGLTAYEDGLLAATGEGLFRASVDQNVAVEPRGKGATAWADIKLAALIPEQSALLPNYPNPFNPETWIPFDLAEPASVSIRIYDARGRVVRALSLGRLAPGRYRARHRAAHWDGRNATGSPVASGVYVVELVAGSYTERRRLVVRK